MSETVISRFNEFLRFCLLICNSVIRPRDATFEVVGSHVDNELFKKIFSPYFCA